MNTFLAFFKLESRRFFSWRNWVIYGALIMLGLSFHFVNSGIQQYIDMRRNKDEFLTFESQKVNQFLNYDQYGSYGFRLYFMPSPVSILFCNSSHFTELTCRIDSGEKLDIHSLFKGKKIFEEKPGKLMDFSGIILILGSLLSLFYGYEAYTHKEYMKFLSSLYGQRQTFLFIWLARVILLCLLFLTVGGISLSLVFINGISIVMKHLFVFLTLVLMMQILFYTAGTIASSFESKLWGGLFIAVSWILSVYLVPALVNKRVEARVEKRQSDYQLELEKLKMLMSFEKEYKEKIEKVRKQYQMLGALYKDITDKKINTPEKIWEWIDSTKREKEKTQGELEILVELDNLGGRKDLSFKDIKNHIYYRYLSLYNEPDQIIRKMALRFQAVEFPKIQAKEKGLLEQIKLDVDFFQSWFSLFPTTFYISTGNEVGSRGYANILKFYENAIGIKKEFMEFYVKHRYGSNPEKIVNFIEEFMKKKGKKEANIFYAASRLPGKFGMGMGFSFTLLWIVGALISSYHFHKRALFRRPKEQIIGLNDLEIDLLEGRSDVMISINPGVINAHLYNVLSGKNRVFKGSITWKSEEKKIDIVTENRKVDFVYICHPDDLPKDIKAADFVLFMGRGLKPSKELLKSITDKLNLNNIGKESFDQLSDREKGQILLEAACLKTSDIYMTNNYLKGMPSDFAEEFKTRMEELKGKKASILYLTNDVFMGRRLGDRLIFLKSEAALATVKW